jgi:hypothetical protein
MTDPISANENTPSIKNDRPLSRWERIRLVFGIDARSAALFRIVLGGMLIADLILRWQTLEMMYTDSGVITRDVASGYWSQIFAGANFWPWISVHHFSGSTEYQVFLFGVAAVFAFMLLIGCFTRIATVVSWILLVSLHARNPMILTSGDTIMKMLLFWSMFIPLGTIWSVDAWRQGRNLKTTRHWIVSVATAGLLIQFCCMYFFTGLAKWNSIWFEGNAMDYVLRLDIYTRPFGKTLLEYPWLLDFISVSTVLVEVFSPFLLFVPFRNHWMRLLNIAIYVSLHASIAMTMSIGLFSYICIMGWIPFIPTIVWCGRGWLRSFRFRPGPATAAQSNADTGHEKIAKWFGERGLSWKKLAVVPGVVMILYFIAWNVNNIPTIRCLPYSLQSLGHLTMVNQHFQMFGKPPRDNPWFVYEAFLNDGTSVDVRSGEVVNHEKPESVLESMQHHHVRKLHRNLVTTEDNISAEPIQLPFRQALGDYYVKKWNQSHSQEQQVKKFRLICYKRPIGPNYNGIDRKHRVWVEFGQDGDLFDREFEKFMSGLK